ncbi:MAG: aminotransferase class I/II-fold pyridoxal phosphate-dependent enzyme [Ignavibacteriae bacterium]|nr:aminotransferase class I/II-fold pyridoxal phosphate-dependent enzyme [Ignavibacteriota bacterium]
MIDLRSDTVTKPSDSMRKAMYNAEVGDDVYKEDPTINKLQEYAADLLGKEDALYVPSGVMGNQICLNVHTQPGDEVICEADAHIFQYESGSPAALSGLQLYPVKGNNGIITIEQIEPMIRPQSAYYMPRTKIVEIENTHNRAGGTIHPIENIKKIKELVKKYNLIFHLDGARLWNASVASGISVSEYSSYFDSVSVCLSKGLGTPVGSIIAGSKDFITEAFRVRKAWGGGMRQVGILAAAGLYALENNIERLEEDHSKAIILANIINYIDSLEINLKNVHTNILIFKPNKISVEEALQKCAEKGLQLSIGQIGSLRAVTHMDASFDDIEKAGKILREVFEK